MGIAAIIICLLWVICLFNLGNEIFVFGYYLATLGVAYFVPEVIIDSPIGARIAGVIFFIVSVYIGLKMEKQH